MGFRNQWNTIVGVSVGSMMGVSDGNNSTPAAPGDGGVGGATGGEGGGDDGVVGGGWLANGGMIGGSEGGTDGGLQLSEVEIVILPCDI